MKVIIGEKYRLTMPDDFDYINIRRDMALRGCYKDIVTIRAVRYSYGIHGDIAKIKENNFWVSFKHLAPLHKILKYNKDKL